jgi:calcium/calmodulin-dependent protein kinase I
MTEYAFKDAKHHPITDDYDIGRQLGTGKFSVVHVVSHKTLKKDYAAKMIDRSLCDNEELAKEVAIMQEIEEHPGVIHLKDVYEEAGSSKFVLILELVRGGELFDKIVEYEFYSEKDAADLVYQILSVVKYLHNKGIVHRDLKPENLLFEDETAKRLKLCDFGLAEKIKENEIMYNVVGSPTYMAPEITLGTGYGKPVDMYSIGVIMYILLCGYPPFEPEEGIIDLEFPSPEWDSINDSVKKLISLLLDKDPSKRPTAEQCLQHPWISGDAASRKALVGTVRTMQTYNTIRRDPGATMRHKEADSKKAVMNIFAMGAPSPRAPTSSLLGTDPFAGSHAIPHLDVPEDGKKRKGSKSTADKKERRKSATPKRKDDSSSPTGAPPKNAGFALSIGEASTRDMIKKLEELRVSSPSGTSPTAASSSKTETSKELTKMKEMYLAEKSRRMELEDQLESASETQQAAEDAANKATTELLEAKKRYDELETQWEDEKVKSYDLKKERTSLQDQLKIAARDVKDAIAASEREKRRATEAEKLKDATAQKLVDANAKLNQLTTTIKVETIVAERLESKRIKELEARVAELEQQLKASHPNGN